MSVSFEEAIFIGHLATSGQKRTFVLVILYTDLSFPFLDFISFLALNAHILPAFTINKT